MAVDITVQYDQDTVSSQTLVHSLHTCSLRRAHACRSVLLFVCFTRRTAASPVPYKWLSLIWGYYRLLLSPFRFLSSHE